MAKVYAILQEKIENVNHIYVPIKATNSPYEGGTQFCADLPNFFGGKVEQGKTIPQTLIKELKEESQDNLVFDSSSFGQSPQSSPKPFFETKVLYRKRREEIPYSFYCLTGKPNPNGGANFQNTNVNGVSVGILNLTPRPNGYLNDTTAAEYEYQCILRIPSTAFNTTYSKNTDGLIQLCHAAMAQTAPTGLANAVKWIVENKQVKDRPQNMKEFENSATKAAFDAFFTNLLK